MKKSVSPPAAVGDRGRRCPRFLVALVVVALTLGCRDPEGSRRAPPPPAPSARPGACASGGQIADAASAPLFPRAAGGFCLDPNGGEKTYGDAATLPLDQICDLFDGECEVYKSHGVRRLVEARYVDGAGSPATVDVHLSKYASIEGAYAMFTRRVVGDGDPADEAMPRVTEGGGAAALGMGNAYLWRGLYLAELTYNDETAGEGAAIKVAADRLLPPLVKDMGGRMPGEATLPPAAAGLPREGLLPLGIRFLTRDMLGVEGAGSGAYGYYRQGERRYRVAVLVRVDADQARDVLGTLARQASATREKSAGEGALRLVRKASDGAPVEWVIARSGKVVAGVGDEERVLRGSAEDRAKVSLTKDEKVERLKRALAGAP